MNAKGFSLIEALVSLLILSVGLLGVAGLQIYAIHYTQISYQHTLVNIQAVDMVERMWTHLAEPLSELNAWQNLNQDSLPGWQGTVVAVANQPNSYVITILWAQDQFDSTDTTSSSYQLTLPKADQ